MTVSESDICSALMKLLGERLDEDSSEYLAATAVSVLSEYLDYPEGGRGDLEEALLPFLEDLGIAEKEGKEAVDKVINLASPQKADKTGIAADPTTIVHIEDFLLAYLGTPLLQEATLTLQRGHVYGLVGRNGVGKTTLLKKISANDVPGFPKHVRSTYVQHEVVPEVEGQTVLDFCRGQKEALEDVGFTPERFSAPVATLSGGWRMRLALARALSEEEGCQVLLLDEPTNHLDPSAVSWLANHILKIKEQMAVMLVSHDPGFMNKVCSDIIHYHKLKLSYYPGNFQKFIEGDVEDVALLTNQGMPGEYLVFNFPRPGALDGVRNDTKSILRLKNVDFGYSDGKQVLKGITCRLCLRSRVCLVGPNGAGKSTLLKVMTGEVIPKVGEVMRHHNLRIALIAQHHVHHLSEHLSLTPVDYIKDRFKGGVDTEILSSASMKETAYELAEKVNLARKHGKLGNQVESLVGRRKDGRELWYEVKWDGLPEAHNEWVSKSYLEEKLGCSKLVSAYDVVVAQRRAGVDQRPLLTDEIVNHLADYGLPKHVAMGKVAGLSGGQKSRLTLATAMWTKPHLIILDEPTNYLDLDALEALADGIEKFRGGVLLVSHNHRFVDRISKETWEMEDGVLTLREGNLVGEGHEEEEGE